MSMSLNRVQLIGNLTKDPEVRSINGDTNIATFSIATNRTYKTESGDKKDIPEFHNIVVFGKLVDIIQKYVKKGQKIYAEGRIKTRSWESEGVKKYRTEIVLQSMIMLSKKSDSTNAQYAPIHEEDVFPEDF